MLVFTLSSSQAIALAMLAGIPPLSRALAEDLALGPLEKDLLERFAEPQPFRQAGLTWGALPQSRQLVHPLCGPW